jgi:hypothetical protein
MPTEPDRIRKAQLSPRCEHKKLNGAQCSGPALKQQKYCRFHSAVHHGKAVGYTLPEVPEDATSIQFAIGRIMRALRDKEWDHKTCGLMLYALQVASSNLKRFNEEQPVCATAQKDDPESLLNLMIRELGELEEPPPGTVE